MNLSEISYQKEGEGWTQLIQENAEYASMIAAMDENVGRIIRTLKDNELDKNTWIIFTSDNGGRSTHFRKNVQTSNGPLRVLPTYHLPVSKVCETQVTFHGFPAEVIGYSQITHAITPREVV